MKQGTVLEVEKVTNTNAGWYTIHDPPFLVCGENNLMRRLPRTIYLPAGKKKIEEMHNQTSATKRGAGDNEARSAVAGKWLGAKSSATREVKGESCWLVLPPILRLLFDQFFFRVRA